MATKATKHKRATPTKLGVQIRKAREKAEMSQGELAYRLRRDYFPDGPSPDGSVISRIERGEIVQPEPIVVGAIAHLLGVPVEVIDLRSAELLAQQRAVLNRVCAPWESNPEPADFLEPLALAA